MRVLGIAGYSGSGKTTLVTRLLPLLKARGLEVATLKHAHHGFARKKCSGVSQSLLLLSAPSRKIPLCSAYRSPRFDWPRSIDPCIKPGKLEQNRSLKRQSTPQPLAS